MNELYLMVTITDRNKTKRYMALYESCGINVTFGMAGYGTAAGEMLEYFGLEQSEKAVLAAVVTDDTWKEAKRGLELPPDGAPPADRCARHGHRLCHPYEQHRREKGPLLPH